MSTKGKTESTIVVKKQSDAPDEDAEALARGSWGGQLEFILTCVGYAVGLGNVWRFPYLCFKNGGGAFLIPYLFMLFFCGLPVFFFEICFGQFASLGPLTIWSASPLFYGIGLGMVVVSIFVSLYYNILVAYIIYFFMASMQSPLPWSDCGNWWNSKQCLTMSEVSNATVLNQFLKENNYTRNDIRSPSEEYYYNGLLRISDGIDQPGYIVWQLAVCLLLAWVVVFVVLIKGIKTLGKVVYFTSLFPYLMMTVMVVRGCTLPGAAKGLEFYLKPDFSKLWNAEVWSDAAAQIFYSLSTCSGGLIAMASYNKFSNNTLRDAVMVSLINCGTSLFAGLAIFSVLGFMAEQKGVEVKDVAASGPGLVFVVYPEGLSQMPGSTVWAILFFFMMLTLGFSSQFSIVECVFVALLDKFQFLKKTPSRPTIFRLIVIICYFLISLPMVTQGGFYLFTIVDSYAGGFPRLFTGLFELIAMAWVYGYTRYAEDVAMMLGKKPNFYFKITWCVLAPIIVIFIIMFRAITHKPSTLFNETYVYPWWADMMGWMMVGAVVIWIPLAIIYRWWRQGAGAALKVAAQPQTHWGPALAANKTGRYAPDIQDATELNDYPVRNGHGGLRKRRSLSLSEASYSMTPGDKRFSNLAYDNQGAVF